MCYNSLVVVYSLHFNKLGHNKYLRHVTIISISYIDKFIPTKTKTNDLRKVMQIHKLFIYRTLALSISGFTKSTAHGKFFTAIKTQ